MENIMHSSNEEISKTLGLEKSTEKKSKKLWYRLIVGLLIVLAIGFYYYFSSAASKIEYITKEVEKGTLTITVSATGNLEPLNKVDVGTEVSGTIEEVFADYNDVVKLGQILAKLDTVKLELKVKSSKASLDVTKANIASAEASLRDAKKSLERYRQIYKSTYGQRPAQKEMDTSTAAYERALATKQSAIAQKEQASAVLKLDEDNLNKAIIRSPIDGIVLVKNIEAGQTVAATLQTPVLFTLAEDLTRMKLIVSVDEADVGQVAEEQKAIFSVDAYPNRSFTGKITQVRLNSLIVNGVVTYEAVMYVDNTELLLRPGMTATADIITKVVKNVLLTPNASLRFTPPKVVMEKVVKEEKASEKMIDKLIPGPPKRDNKTKITDDKAKSSVWVLKEGKPIQVFVETGDSDTILTVLTSDDIKPGTKVIVNTKED